VVLSILQFLTFNQNGVLSTLKLDGMLTEKVGESVKNYRELRKITREDMADRLGMTVSGYGKIERGETDVPLSRLEKISDVLGVSVSQILQFDAQQIFNISNNNMVQGAGNRADTINYHPDAFKDKYIEALERENELLRQKLNSGVK
jgi:transcriptional regulator with XRE-family HTH domain